MANQLNSPQPNFDAFGHPIRPSVGQDCSDRYLTQYQYVPNHESLGYDLTSENVEPIDLVKMTQSYRNECGIEAMKILLASHQKTPEDFADDGTGSADLTNFPDNVNDAFRAVGATKAAAAESVSALGGTVEDAIKSGKLDDYVKGLVNAQLEKAKAAEAAKEVKVNA